MAYKTKVPRAICCVTDPKPTGSKNSRQLKYINKLAVIENKVYALSLKGQITLTHWMS